MARRRRWWAWLLLALLLLAAALLLYGRLAPAGERAAAFSARDRVVIVAVIEAAWIAAIVAARGVLLGRGGGIVGRALRYAAIGVTFAGVTGAALGGWLVWSFLGAEVHGGTVRGGGDWDDD